MNTKDDFEFIGWVPCISGRLFYEYTECGLCADDAPLIDINHMEKIEGDELSNSLIVSSKVNWQDDDDSELDGNYLVILVCRYKLEDEILNGSIYVYPYEKSKSKSFLATQEIKRIEQNANAKNEVGKLTDELTEYLNEFDDEEFFKVNFEVNKSGFARLKLDNDEGVSYQDKKLIIRQSYYYIKYLLHRHQHHDSSCDSLTTIHHINKIDKNKIGLYLLDDLRRSLVQMKRDFNATEYRNLLNSKGIVSYAKSLVESCYRNGYLSADNYDSEKHYFDNMATSLSVMTDCAHEKISSSLKISNNVRSIILFMFAIVAPITIVYRDYINTVIGNSVEKPMLVDLIANILASNGGQALAVLCMLLFYVVYSGVHTKIGRTLLSFSLVSNILFFFVYDKQKANILTGILYVLTLMLLFLIITSIYYAVMAG